MELPVSYTHVMMTPSSHNVGGEKCVSITSSIGTAIVICKEFSVLLAAATDMYEISSLLFLFIDRYTNTHRGMCCMREFHIRV